MSKPTLNDTDVIRCRDYMKVWIGLLSNEMAGAEALGQNSTNISSAGSGDVPAEAPAATQAQQAQDDDDQPRCWDHGCNGRVFANWSNLNRHRREKEPTRFNCEKCGMQFTRRSALETHTTQDRCSTTRRPRHLS